MAIITVWAAHRLVTKVLEVRFDGIATPKYVYIVAGLTVFQAVLATVFGNFNDFLKMMGENPVPKASDRWVDVINLMFFAD